MADRPESKDLRDLLDKVRFHGECDDCAAEAAALASGYDPVGNGGWRMQCENKCCRFYDAEYAAHLANIDADTGYFGRHSAEASS